MRSNPATAVHETGRVAGAGSFICVGCGFTVTLAALDAIPECPGCGGSAFRRASLFEQPTVDVAAIEVEPEPDWLGPARERLAGEGREGRYLAYDGENGPTLVAIPEGWSRIGRSASAEIRLDHPTVSRRHAVIVSTPGRGLRALDDRSLNGLFVNGEAVEWSHLEDGDELEVGRFHLHVIDTTGSPAGAEDSAPALNR